jgi:hypothetical protein
MTHEVERALAGTLDWSGATFEHGPSQGTIAYSVPLSGELTSRLEAEAERRGVTASVLIHPLVAAAILGPQSDATV